MKDIFNEENIKFVLDHIGTDYKYNKFNENHFKCAVDLVWSGILNYNKLISENYNFWWYETNEPPPYKKDNYTFNFIDLSLSKKGQMYKEYLTNGKYKFIGIPDFIAYWDCLIDGNNKNYCNKILSPYLNHSQMEFNFNQF